MNPENDERSPFSREPYFKVNREERFYCALFAHALLMSRQYREAIANLMNDRLTLKLDPDHMEVFLEVAALRDYWNALGKHDDGSGIPVRKPSDVRKARHRALQSILAIYGVDSSRIEHESMFWSKGRQPKIQSPARWGHKARIDRGSKSDMDAKLALVGAAFNAKPDLLLLSPHNGVVIEAKVESPIGHYADIDSSQIEIQEMVVELWKRLIPAFSGVTVVHTTLTIKRKEPNGLTWQDVVDRLNDDEIDKFTLDCLRIGLMSGRP